MDEDVGTDEWLDSFFGDSNHSNPSEEVVTAVKDPRRRESLLLNLSEGDQEASSLVSHGPLLCCFVWNKTLLSELVSRL